VIAGRGHLKEARLFECYLAERCGDDLAPSAAAHLAGCDECARRYSELSRLLNDEHLDAEAEADALFSTERLLAQRQHLLARVEHAGQAARVLSFPVRAGRRASPHSTRPLPRWAAAAAAGIFLGMGLHIAYENSRGEPSGATDAAALISAPPPAAVEPAGAAMDPDTFFSTLDAALGGPRDPELMPLDELTPLAHDVSLQVR
jgi:hypothetical protein